MTKKILLSTQYRYRRKWAEYNRLRERDWDCAPDWWLSYLKRKQMFNTCYFEIADVLYQDSDIILDVIKNKIWLEFESENHYLMFLLKWS